MGLVSEPSLTIAKSFENQKNRLIEEIINVVNLRNPSELGEAKRETHEFLASSGSPLQNGDFPAG
jgi:hypothetical protein